MAAFQSAVPTRSAEDLYPQITQICADEDKRGTKPLAVMGASMAVHRGLDVDPQTVDDPALM
jgi:hypothetical protein